MTVNPAEVITLREQEWPKWKIARTLHIGKKRVDRIILELRPDLEGKLFKARNRAETKARELGYTDLQTMLAERCEQEQSMNQMARELGTFVSNIDWWLKGWDLHTSPGIPGNPHFRPQQPGGARPKPKPAQVAAEPAAGIDWQAVIKRARDRIEARPVITTPGPVKLAPGERWCPRCGETLMWGYCYRCGSNSGGIDPQSVLNAGEWYQ